jgi:hypothetical protein
MVVGGTSVLYMVKMSLIHPVPPRHRPQFASLDLLDDFLASDLNPKSIPRQIFSDFTLFRGYDSFYQKGRRIINNPVAPDKGYRLQ